MKNLTRILIVILGCLIIAFAIDFIIVPNYLTTFGYNGLSIALYYNNGVNIGLNILIFNVISILIASLFLNKQIIKDYLLPSFLIPLFTFLLNFLTPYFVIEFPEKILTILVSGCISGIGYSMIYKQGNSAGCVFLLEEVIGKLTHFHSKIYSWFIDIITLLIIFMEFKYEVMLYSLISIFITKYLITKARFGINDSKMFYIITSKEKEVKDFILHDLKYELTVLDVKGGFSKKNKKILLTVISSNDYYKLKEGVKLIDDKSFIAITDTYDVVNRRSF